MVTASDVEPELLALLPYHNEETVGNYRGSEANGQASAMQGDNCPNKIEKENKKKNNSAVEMNMKKGRKRRKNKERKRERGEKKERKDKKEEEKKSAKSGKKGVQH